MTTISLINVAKYYKGKPHQIKALERLEEQIRAVRPELLEDSSDFIRAWRTPLTPDQPSNTNTGGNSTNGTAGATGNTATRTSYRLNVPYFSQLDNENNPHGSCNVTSLAMCMAFYGHPMRNPKTGEQLEDELYRYMGSNNLSRHSPQDLDKVFTIYGYEDDFRPDAKWADVKASIDAGRPCVVHGWFTRSGHIIVIIGYNEKGWVVHDPYGEWYSSGYDTSVSGAGLTYTYQMMKDVCGPDGDLWIHFTAPGKTGSVTSKGATSGGTAAASGLTLQELFRSGKPIALKDAAKDTNLIKQIQVRLGALKLIGGKADGSYGPITENAIVRFAKAYNLPTDRLTPEFAKQIIQAKSVPGFDPSSELISPELTAELLECPLQDARTYLPGVLNGLNAKGILNKATLIAALATIGVETAGFRPIKEWGDDGYFTEMYEGRDDLGNNRPGDGVRYHGRGFIQITGRANYRFYGQKLGVPLEEKPDLALDPDIAAKILIEYFWDREVDKAAAEGDWKGVRKLVNGGLNGWDHFWPLVQKLQSRLV